MLIHSKYLTRTLIPFFCLYSLQTNASSIAIAAGQFEQHINIGENSKTLTPKGYQVAASFGLSEHFSVSADLGQFEQEDSFSTNANIKLKKNTWGIAGNYFWQDYSVSLRYAKVSEDISVRTKRANNIAYQEEFTAPTYGFSASYSFTLGNENKEQLWYINTSFGVQHTDWELDLLRLHRPFELTSNQLTQSTGVDAGDNTFADIGIAASHYIPYSDNNGVYFGLSLSWNHLISGETSIISRNGRSISQLLERSNSRLVNSRATYLTQAVEGEEYGLTSIFVSFDISHNWSLDLDYSTSFAADENADSAYITLAYAF